MLETGSWNIAGLFGRGKGSGNSTGGAVKTLIQVNLCGKTSNGSSSSTLLGFWSGFGPCLPHPLGNTMVVSNLESNEAGIFYDGKMLTIQVF